MRRTLAVLALSLGACYTPQHPEQQVVDGRDPDGSAIGNDDGGGGSDCLGGNTIAPKVCAADFAPGDLIQGSLVTDDCPVKIMQSSNEMVCLVAVAGNLTVANALITGTLPVVFAARGNIDITGDVAVDAGQDVGAGPTGQDPCSSIDSAGTPDLGVGGGGGGGGGFQGDGGNGGAGGAVGQTGVSGISSPLSIRGGCKGGSGGSANGSTTGGSSGGAAFFLSGGDIHVGANVTVNGHGGVGGLATNRAGGGGGGSGGLLGFQAHAITVVPTNALTAKGGSGGGGAGDKGDGGPGKSASPADTGAAQGGSGGASTAVGGSTGGKGSFAGNDNGGSVPAGGFAGGGGGGGAGFLLFFTVEKADTTSFPAAPAVQASTITQP